MSVNWECVCCGGWTNREDAWARSVLAREEEGRNLRSNSRNLPHIFHTQQSEDVWTAQTHQANCPEFRRSREGREALVAFVVVAFVVCVCVCVGWQSMCRVV